jgi:hypothetical protein
MEVNSVRTRDNQSPNADTGSNEQDHAVIRRPLPSSPFNVPTVARPVERFELNDRVTHDSYGLGSVIGIEPDVAVLVDFGPRQERLVAPYPRLTKL